MAFNKRGEKNKEMLFFFFHVMWRNAQKKEFVLTSALWSHHRDDG